MIRTRLLLPVLCVLATLASGCGGSHEEKAGDDPTATASASASVSPGPGASTPTATTTGPSGKTPAERRDELGGCPTPARIEELGGAPVTRSADPGPTVICAYTSTRTAQFGEMTAPAVEISVSEPVALPGGQDLGAYRREVDRSNPSADATDLGGAAFYSYFDDSPAVCAVWFTADDEKVLTVSSFTLVAKASKAGPRSPACALARDVAADFRG